MSLMMSRVPEKRVRDMAEGEASGRMMSDGCEKNGGNCGTDKMIKSRVCILTDAEQRHCRKTESLVRETRGHLEDSKMT